MYLLSITVGLCVVYLILHALLPYFFFGARRPLTARSALSIALIIVMSFAGYIAVVSMSDLEWGNRLLHAWGGGFMSFFICFRVVRDAKLEISRFQFVVMGALIVTSLGVANEIIEYFLQTYGVMVFLRTADDTWLDLISNTVGIIGGAAALGPFVRKPQA